MLTPEQLEFTRQLEPAPAHWGGTGAQRKREDARDYPALWHPGYRAVAEAGEARDVDWTNKVCSLTNQGSTGACVIHSTCSGIQVNEEISQGVCYRFNPQQLYTELGGTGSNGIDSRLALERCKNVGAPLANSSQRIRIGSYFSLESNPATFADQVRTALTARKAVVIALLLPSTFGGKWTPGNPTTGYHQLDCVGTQGDLFWGPNSWGEQWGGGAHPPGFYELSFSYICSNAMQHGYCYGLFFDAVAVNPPPPPPPPPPPTKTTYLISGRYTSERGEAPPPAGGHTTFSSVTTPGDFAVLTVVKEGGGPPPPGQLAVTGYTPNPVKGGTSFIINGQGFEGGNLTTSWQGQSLAAQRLGDTQIQATAPSVGSPAAAVVTVRVEGATADGPPLTVTASDGQPGQLKVTVIGKRYTRGIVGIWAYLQEPGSAALELIVPGQDAEGNLLRPTVLNPEGAAYVAGQIQGSIGSVVLAPSFTSAGGMPATWQVRGVPEGPQTITVTGTATDGRTGTGQGAV